MNKRLHISRQRLDRELRHRSRSKHNASLYHLRFSMKQLEAMQRSSRRWKVAALAAVLTVPGIASAQTDNHKDKKPMKNIVQVAIEAGSFNTLVAAVKAAGLVETLSGPGPFTVFAPTDRAFAKLPEGT